MSLRWLALACSLALPLSAAAQERSFHALPTGNGHGFSVFERERGRIETFLEHPYRYVAPGNAAREWGIGRRNLAHDLYFGVRIGARRAWLERDAGQREVSYEAESHVVHGSSREGGLLVDTYYFAPFGFAGNGLVALIRVRNDGPSAATASVFWKPNLKLGAGEPRETPGDEGEVIDFDGTAAVETGPGGGHALVVPIGAFDHASCGADATLYDALAGTGPIGTAAHCTGTAQVMVLGKDLQIAPGGESWWGAATLFVDDDPGHPRAATFQDRRSAGELLALWQAFAARREARALHDDALAEHESFRKPETMPAGLSEAERRLWRQSETVLRMAQVREPSQENRHNDGMILAALPPGEWHIGWVRDASYAIAALARSGHHDMAQRGLEFLLGADGATGGFFADGYLGQPYRVSATRFFGNGLEEGDFNQDGPNVETDGWGLVLWAAFATLHASCDRAWLEQPTWRGDSVYEALSEVADDILTNLQDDLPKPDASIWEVHWQRRQVFAFTAAAQARGLFDFAAIAEDHGDTERAERVRAQAERLRARMLEALVYAPRMSLVSHLGVAHSEVSVDGSTVEALLWGLVAPQDPVFAGTLASYSRLKTPFGGYQRLEPELSLIGENGAGGYDAIEWILLDLHIGEALRRAGQSAEAAARLGWVTGAAQQNDLLIPEGYDRNDGTYTGAVPMVGYGAGAWLTAQLDVHGRPGRAPGESLAHCDAPPEPGADAGTDAGASATPDRDGGAPDDAGSAPPRSSHGSGCMLHRHGDTSGSWLPLLCALLALSRARRRTPAVTGTKR
jgi:hypothetical protein